MKKEWTEPEIKVQKFEPNEYVAACWRIHCNVPTGFGFIDGNKNGKFDKNNYKDTRLTSDGTYGCGVWHGGVQGVPDDGPTENAMWQPQVQKMGAYVNEGAAYPVYYWSDGEGQYHRHFSKVSDAEWESNPNAS